MEPTNPPNDNFRFHRQHNLKYGWNALQKAIDRGQITKDDHSLIKEYIIEYQATRRVGESRLVNNLFYLVAWRAYLHVQYRDATMTDLYTAINEITTGVNKRGTPFKQNTLHDYFRILKKFFTWLIENEYSEIPLNKLLKIKTPPVDQHTTDPKNLLTKEDIIALIEATKKTMNPVRNMAIIATLYDSGCRVGELASLKWKDMVWDNHGIGLYIEDKKVKGIRYARLVMAGQYLSNWKDLYPFKPEGDALVFITENRTPMEYHAIWQVLSDAKKVSGITKRVHFHLFRKSHITHMVTDGYQESIIKKIHWNNVSTNQFETYVRLSEKDIDDEIMKKQGIVIEREKAPDVLKPRPCTHCHTINGPTFNFCGTCGKPLTVDVQQDYDAKIRIAREQQEYKERLDSLKTYETQMAEMNRKLKEMEDLKKELEEMRNQGKVTKG